MIISHRRVSWGVWPLWVVAGALSGAVGAGFWDSTRLSNTAPSGFFLGEAALTLSMLVVLILPGFLQWLILRRWDPEAKWWILSGALWPARPGAGRPKVPQARWWMLSSAVGSLVGFLFVGWAVAVADTEPWGPAFDAVAFAALLLLGGAAAGALQWLAALPWFPLRRWAANAGWWLLTSSISWLAGTWVFLLVTRAGDAQPAWLYFILGGAATGALAAAITGTALVWLLHNDGLNQPSVRGKVF